MTTPQQQIVNKCNAVFALATEKYGLDLSQVGIRFDLKGRAAGMACRRGTQYYMRFNRDMLTREAFEHVINNTVPHEVAHIVCFMNPRLGRNHDGGWARVCRELGGTGATRHSEEVVYGKGTTYEYITDRGHKVRMSDRYHALVQAGRPLRYRKGLGTVTKECQYSIVGVQGRTLAAPRTVVPPVTKEVPVKAIVPAYPVPTAWKTVTTPAPVQIPTCTVAPAPHFREGASKAAISRSIMLAGHNRGQTYEQIISAMMLANGYDRQLAKATYKANMAKVGITE